MLATRISLWLDDCISGCAKEGSAICIVAKLNAPLMCLVDEIIVEMFEVCKRTFAAKRCSSLAVDRNTKGLLTATQKGFCLVRERASRQCLRVH